MLIIATAYIGVEICVFVLHMHTPPHILRMYASCMHPSPPTTLPTPLSDASNGDDDDTQGTQSAAQEAYKELQQSTKALRGKVASHRAQLEALRDTVLSSVCVCEGVWVGGCGCVGGVVHYIYIVSCYMHLYTKFSLCLCCLF